MERPITMCDLMVRALLDPDHPKTMTRRVAHQFSTSGLWTPVEYTNRAGNRVWGQQAGDVRELSNIRCPYGKVGDRLYVREAVRAAKRVGMLAGHNGRGHESVVDRVGEAPRPVRGCARRCGYRRVVGDTACAGGPGHHRRAGDVARAAWAEAASAAAVGTAIMTTDQYAVLACWANWPADALRYPDLSWPRWNCRRRSTCPQGDLCRRFQERHGGRAVSVARDAIKGEGGCDANARAVP